MKAYERFERFLSSSDFSEGMDFECICRHIHASPASLNEIIEEELGFSGEDFVAAYRKCI